MASRICRLSIRGDHLLEVRDLTVNLSNAIQPDESSERSQAYRDLLGITASIACAIHCAAMPFVIGFLPLLGLSFLADPAFHKWMVGICLLFALLAFVPGWKRHRQMRPAIIGIGGLFLISLAAFAGPEDCCPTPCDGSAEPPSQIAAVPLMTTKDDACSASCCSSDVPAPADAAKLVSLAPMDDASTVCANSCCPPVAAPIMMVAQDDCTAQCCSSDVKQSPGAVELVSTSMSESGLADCALSCCPPEATIEEPLTAGMVRWMWILMTPLGGLVLVAAHLYNHRSSCHCSAGCCDGPAQTPKQ